MFNKLTLFFVLILFSSISIAQTTPSLKGKKIILVYGGWAGHAPKESIETIMPWLIEEGALIDTFSTTEVYADSILMAKVDLIIQAVTMSTITKEQESGLIKAVNRGAGIAGWHGGLADSFRQNVGYQFMIGGQWVAHPGGIIDYTVNITNKKDPISKGIKDFKMHSEQYYMHVDPNVTVLATTEFSGQYNSGIKGCVMPVVWKKTHGKGRVFYSSLGHAPADLKTPEAMEILKRGIRWCAESKYQVTENLVSPVY